MTASSSGREEAEPRSPERFVTEGFVVLRGLINPACCARALAAIRRHVGDERPLYEWTSERPGRRYELIAAGAVPELDALARDPRLASALDAVFGRTAYSFAPPEESPRIALWINPYDSGGQPRLLPLGHIDSGPPGRGLAVQIALSDTEPFGGNTSFFPASHHAIHRFWGARGGDQTGGNYHQVPRPRPAWEFVAQAGDAVLCHHLLAHSGNPCHGASHLPRIAVRFEAFVDGAADAASPWARAYTSAD